MPYQRLGKRMKPLGLENSTSFACSRTRASSGNGEVLCKDILACPGRSDAQNKAGDVVVLGDGVGKPIHGFEDAAQAGRRTGSPKRGKPVLRGGPRRTRRPIHPGLR